MIKNATKSILHDQSLVCCQTGELANNITCPTSSGLYFRQKMIVTRIVRRVHNCITVNSAEISVLNYVDKVFPE